MRYLLGILLLSCACAGAPMDGVGGNSGSSVSSGDSATESPDRLIADALVFDLEEPKHADAKSLWATYYYVPKVPQASRGFPLRDMRGKKLGTRLNRRDWCEAAMQGTVVVDHEDGPLTINYAGTRKNVEVDCRPVYPKHPAIGRSRFVLATGPYGDGVRGMVIIPFRSIAVDPETIPFGSLVYIPAARGTELTLPDGSHAIHDGYFFAADRGGAIKDEHIDVFVGIGKNNPFSFVLSKASATFDAFVIEPDRAEEAFERLSRAHWAFRPRK